jgi:23S rRNA (uracil1939-C5)-methyltransferase
MAVKAERKAVPRRLEALQAFAMRWDLSRLAVNGESHLAPRQPVVAMGAAQVPLPVGAFLQATRIGEEALAGLVLKGMGNSRSVADLFCGVGPFALRLARLARVSAWDSDRAAVAALQTAARKTQGLKPVTAEVRDLFRAPLVPGELNAFDGVVFDPPRAGAEAQARELAKSKVKRVVAVACDVQSFARDAAVLVAGGFRLTQVVPVDQFKWTAHLEMVGVFER